MTTERYEDDKSSGARRLSGFLSALTTGHDRFSLWGEHFKYQEKGSGEIDKKE
ncbi:hypothetical protein [Pantoea sp. 1B4]|uniref:hypothetical protein n=1 Tax=Pantoea sp. 1B4 TaxID=2804760 RepID=UPI001AA56266|nr:hypothetical protein [Pantoea sp. 1B4]MBN1089290.1 hypothetical protein [Pantoea sp. 1B4]MCX2192431.1 hypothetical protein [Pantoea agglomerans]